MNDSLMNWECLKELEQHGVGKKMAFVRQMSSGAWVLCVRKGIMQGTGKVKKGNEKSWFFVKTSNENVGFVEVSKNVKIFLPEEFKGKRVRFIMEELK